MHKLNLKGGIFLINEMRDNLFHIVSVFYIIIYARLSKEEEGKTTEEQSKSIQNQIDICRRYIEDEKQKYPNIKFEIVAELFDDGISGTTFERDDFKELIKLIENKKANMVITKDQSRFGREHIESDNYMERWFPEHNVRYVAVLDGVDTYVPESANNDMAPIKNWMNEMYAKHTSRAVKATKRENAKKGIWNGGEPPLGLQIDSNNEGSLIIEPVGAEIIKRIFNLALENKSINQIADILIKEKVPIPTILKGNKRCLNLDLVDLWNTSTIRYLLENEMYKGTMVQCKTTTLSHKSKKIIYLPKEDWIRVPNKVPPIIEESKFDNVQLLIGTNRNTTTNSHDYLLKGILRCRECHHSISIQHYNNRKNNYTICNYYRKYGKRKEVCTAHRFIYEDLEKLVLNSIKKECLKYVNDTNCASKLKNKKQSKELQTSLKLKINKSKREITKLDKYLDKMYKRLDTGIIGKEQYIRLRKETEEAITYHQNNINYYEKELQGVIDKSGEEPNYTKIIKDFLSLKKPNKILITKLIKVIYISEDGQVDIHYKVKNPNKDIAITK